MARFSGVALLIVIRETYFGAISKSKVPHVLLAALLYGE